MSVVVTPIITATHAEWMATTKPVVSGRVLYETDTGNYKVGDGTSLYSALSVSTNFSTFTNYIFMVPLDEIGGVFSGNDGSGGSGNSGSGTTSLWAPGAPTLANWEKYNPDFTNTAVTVVQNGTNAVSITCDGQIPVEGTVNLQLGGFMLDVPTAPYKVLFGYNSLPTPVWGYDDANDVNTGYSVSGMPMGIGWTNGTEFVFFNPGATTPNNYQTANINWYRNSSDHGSVNVYYDQNLTSPSSPGLASPGNLFYILSDDGAGNVTLSETNDGKTENVLFTLNKASNLYADAGAFSKFFLAVGFPPTSQSGIYSAGGSITNLFLYDPNVAGRVPVAPAY